MLMILQSLMAQSSGFPLRKPPGFHYDFFLLGVATFIAGLLGVPAPNGLIPQAPIHTTSLLVMGYKSSAGIDQESRTTPQSQGHSSDPQMYGINPPLDVTMIDRVEMPIAVVEQRVSNLAQGALCLVLLTGPCLHVLGLIPRGMIYLCNYHVIPKCLCRCLGWLIVSLFPSTSRSL